MLVLFGLGRGPADGTFTFSIFDRAHISVAFAVALFCAAFTMNTRHLAPCLIDPIPHCAVMGGIFHGFDAMQVNKILITCLSSLPVHQQRN